MNSTNSRLLHTSSELFSNQITGTIPSTIGALSGLVNLYESYLDLLSCFCSIYLALLSKTACCTLISFREPFHQRLVLSPIFKSCTTTVPVQYLESRVPFTQSPWFRCSPESFSRISCQELFLHRLDLSPISKLCTILFTFE